MICPHTKYEMYISDSLLVIVTKPEIKNTCNASVML
jgi:hypothetical protein